MKSKTRWSAQLMGVLLCALGLKLYYSAASPDELRWILAPTAWLVETLSGRTFSFEAHAGYMSSDHTFLIARSCAGVNFLVICFLTLYFCFSRCFHSKLRWLMWSAALSYFAAIAANGLRIYLSAHLWIADFYLGWITQGQMHRLAGTVVYYASLIALYVVVESFMGVKASRFGPLLWYIGITLGIPLVGRIAVGGTSEFSQHAVWVVAIAVTLSTVIFLPSVLRNRVFWRS